MESQNQKWKRTRHEFLLTFFSPEPIYQIKEINGYFLAKYHNNATNQWEVAIYTKEAFEKVEKWKSSKYVK